MKKLYFVVICLLAKVAVGQTIEAVHPNLAFSGPDNMSHSIDLEIKNSGSIPLTILVNRTSQSLTGGHESYFCWFECYDPTTSLSPVPITLQPGEITINFHGYVTPNSIGGLDTVTYSFYDQNGNSDTLTLSLTYDFLHDGINDLSSKKNALSVFVNQDKTAMINYSCSAAGDSKIQICNILGKVQKEIVLTDKAGAIKVPVSGIMQGVYFCNLIVDGKFTASRKFFIQQ